MRSLYIECNILYSLMLEEKKKKSFLEAIFIYYVVVIPIVRVKNQTTLHRQIIFRFPSVIMFQSPFISIRNNSNYL